MEGTIPPLEDDEEVGPPHVDRNLRSLVRQPGFEAVRGIVLGRFQRASNMDPETLRAILDSKPELDRIPVVADASFGHTTPQFTFPIGGHGVPRAGDGIAKLLIARP